MKVVTVTQARYGSSRLPGKVLKKIAGATLLEIQLRRASRSGLTNKLIVATTHEPESEEICNIAAQCGASCFKGSMDDVLDRYYQAVKNEQADYIVRITSDCPLVDPVLIDEIINHTITNKLDYCTNAQSGTYPDGMDVEVFTFAALETAWKEANVKSEREHVTPFIWKNSSICNNTRFKAEHYSYIKDYSKIRLTVDEEADFILIEKLINKMGTHISWLEYTEYLIQHPDVLAINADIIRNEGYLKSIQHD